MTCYRLLVFQHEFNTRKCQTLYCYMTLSYGYGALKVNVTLFLLFDNMLIAI